MNDNLDIRPIQAADIPAIARLMLRVHGNQTRLTEAYLTWQYVDNPDGEAIGYNAWDGDALVAHYACCLSPSRMLALRLLALLRIDGSGRSTPPPTLTTAGRGCFPCWQNRPMSEDLTRGSLP